MKPQTRSILTQGLVAGLIGYVVVAGLFFVANVIAGRPPFYTVAVLGGTLFYGWTEPADVVIWAGPIFAYNGAHAVVFVILGVIAAWLASNAERGPQLWYLGLSVFIFVIVHIVGALTWMGALVRTVLPLGLVVAASVLAAAAMALYLWRVHPTLRREFREYEDQPT